MVSVKWAWARSARSPGVTVQRRICYDAAEATYLHSGEIETGAVDLDAGVKTDSTSSSAVPTIAFVLGFLGGLGEFRRAERARELPNGDVEYRNGAGDVWQFKPSAGRHQSRRACI